ncbi:uncharacterized protein LOC110460442 [Mizuhopecten yessoensis]|uniref:Ras association domain-containing protein 8 n=1 Tax=Mizuhopecten yessoensis TaxID=6573 RepID=A0A210Q2I7_MIZYE|nr:uncharacterized protein LOC110460442 [Mizuhopecten yessoensis]XP_021369009.1 uncharacterized protein LOC110460442 [Mizuhopecten yessoensis]XP_021369010.1 uncharacterized protein LOC110460442 [Mizuhopecten yessoensis]XP_021369011.1 uncharacterized protein LOC110460442 [Mizuhopecten yessoensis]XP_021369012.1 uncharacterized protein LOC110460442 [Mizuhopecten yessoensis]XP_021369013.1 uncharacterized protein LOC110460442 [Mizuhopecten yessoensis]XP_021369014.1 uncharacterized protein LOC11046
MELKVRVDGILRVVCGVTETSTCQDVVIALAHAMGKTGRFTLIEKWRENERPLLPDECPVKILQKWGEYATEVQLLLKHSGKQKTDIPPTNQQKENNKPKINLTSAPRDTGIRKSLTFSGAHHVAPEAARPRQRYLQMGKNLDKHETSSVNSQPILPRHREVKQNPVYGVGVRLKATQGGEPQPNILPLNSHNSVNSDLDPRVQLHSQVQGENVYPRERTHVNPDPHPSLLQQTGPRTRQAQHRTEHHRVASPYNNFQQAGGSHSKTTNHSFSHQHSSGITNTHGNVKPSIGSNNNNESSISILPLVQNRVSRPSAFQPVPQKPRADSLDLTQPAHAIGSLPVYHARPVNSEVEEYDLDSNFPDVLKNSRKEVLIEEYTMPDDHHNGSALVGVKEVLEPDPQVVKMQRLVSQQQERIRMQESQLQMIDTELVSLEDEDRQSLDQKHSIGEEMTCLQQTYNQNEAEVVQLAAVSWVDIINAEKTREKSYRSDILIVKDKTDTCVKDLEINNEKISELEKQVTSEKQELEECRQEQEREITQIRKDAEDVKGELEKGVKTFNTDSKCMEEVEEELKSSDEKKESQSKEVETLEKQIKEVNIQELNMVGKGEKSGKNGKAVLQALEGRLSPHPGLGGRKYIASPLSKVLSVSKNPNGVWV